MADEVDGRIGLDVLENPVEVGDVILKPVGVGLGPVGEPIAAPVRRIDVPAGIERIHKELEGSRNVHPAVQQDHFARGIARPAPHVVAEAADVEEQGFALAHGGRDDS